MPDLAELELRIRSGEAQLATRRLREMASASQLVETRAKTMTGRVAEFGKSTAIAASTGFTFVQSLRAVAGVIVARKVGSMVAETIGTVEQLRDLAIQLGATVKDIQELQFAADQSGTSIEELAQALTIGTAAVEEFQTTSGKGPAGGIIKALGLEEAAMQARNFIDMLPQLNEKFKELDAGEQVAVTRKLFGRAGPAQIQLLTSNIAELRREFNEWGDRITDKTAGAIDNVSDAANKLGAAWKSLKNQVISDNADWLARALEGTGKFLRDPIGHTMAGPQPLGPPLFHHGDAATNAARLAEYNARQKVLDIEQKIARARAAPQMTSLFKPPEANLLPMYLNQLEAAKAEVDAIAASTNTWSQETIDLANSMGKAAEERRKLGLPIDFVGPLPQDSGGGLLKRAADIEKVREAEERAMEGLDEFRLGIESERVALSALSEDRELAITLLDIERLAKEGGTEATRKMADEIRGEAIALNEYRKGIAALERLTEENKQRIAGAVDELSGSFANFATDAVFEIKSVEDAFEDLIKGLSAQVLNNVLKQAVGGLLSSAFGATGGGSGNQLGSIIGSLFSSEVAAQARGNLFRGGNELMQFASGGFPSGITNTPTYFPMSRGRTGVASEFGQEEWAIAPLARTPGGKLGVDVRGERNDRKASQPIVVNQYIKTQDVDSFRRSRRQLAADMKRAAGLTR